MQFKFRERKQHSEVSKSIEKTLPALQAFARTLTADKMSADDLVQASCERALQKSNQVTDLGGIKSWLNRIVYTQWLDSLRKKGRLKEESMTEEADVSVRQRNTEEKYITKLDIEKALKYLSAEHRAAVVLVTVLGYSYEEAAELIGVPTGTVASRVARGRIHLAQHLRSKNINEL